LQKGASWVEYPLRMERQEAGSAEEAHGRCRHGENDPFVLTADRIGQQRRDRGNRCPEDDHAENVEDEFYLHP